MCFTGAQLHWQPPGKHNAQSLDDASWSHTVKNEAHVSSAEFSPVVMSAYTAFAPYASIDTSS